MLWRCRNVASSFTCASATSTSCPGPGCCLLRTAPGSHRVGAVHATGNRSKLLLRFAQLAQRDGEQPIGAERNAFIELQFAFEILAAQAERRLGPRGKICLQILDVVLDGMRRLGRRVGQISEDVKVVEARKGAREIGFDELEDAPPGFEADLDENPRALTNIVAGRLHEPRRLPELGHYAPGAVGLRGVVEQRLSGEARA